MELREFAENVVLSDSLEAKLQRVTSDLTDVKPGPVLRPGRPGRPAHLIFGDRGSAPAMPKGQAFAYQHKRAIAHHIMANHELQALEVMAMILLAFPSAPAEFRMGLTRVMFDEQRHTRMHVQRAAELGVTFGDFPVNSYIWQKATEYQSVLEYIAGLPLVFEGRNLDHTVEFETYFIDVGDRRSAAIMRAIHKDEIRHVEFGIHWLRKLKSPHQTDFEAWQQSLHWPMRPSSARGETVQTDARLQAGMSPEFVKSLVNWEETEEQRIAGRKMFRRR